MVHEKFKVEGQNPKNGLIIADDVEFIKIQRFAKELLESSININDIGRSIELISNVSQITIRGNTFKDNEITTVISSAKKMRFLSIPSEFANVLSSFSIDSLETLQITGTQNVHFPDSFKCLGIKRFLSWPCITFFKQSQMPNATDFFIQLDNKDKVINELKKYDSLRVLTLSKQNDLKHVNFNSANSVEFLRLIDNTFSSLEGLSAFSCLTDLFIQNNNNLKSLGDIVFCKKLDELTISYCSELDDVSVLSELNIRKLSIYGCPKLKKIAVEKSIQKLNLDECVLNLG